MTVADCNHDFEPRSMHCMKCGLSYEAVCNGWKIEIYEEEKITTTDTIDM